jgi:DNA-directed RNA polymerase subunit RPC12/RpoP
MPLYEYSCQKCSYKIELLIRGDEKPVCPHCQSWPLLAPQGVRSARSAASPGMARRLINPSSTVSSTAMSASGAGER